MDSLRRGPKWSLALLGFRDAVVMLRRGDSGSTDDARRGPAVEEERAGKLDKEVEDVLAAMKLLRPFFTPTSLALNGTKDPVEGKIGEVNSVSAERGPFRPSSKMELFVVSRLIEDRRITESFLM